MVLLVASSAQSEDVFTTLFYDPAQLALVSSSGGPDEVPDPGGFGSKGLVLVSPPALKQGVPGEIIAVARTVNGGTWGLGPDLAGTLEFEVLDDSNPIELIQGFGLSDPTYQNSPEPSLFVPEPIGSLLIGILALAGWRTPICRKK